MDDSTSDDEQNENTAQIRESLETLKAKNVELRENLSYLKIENLSYKQRYQSLKQNLTSLSRLLEQNVQIYNELFDDTRSALEIARVSILASPNVRKEARQPHVEKASTEKSPEDTNTENPSSNNELDAEQNATAVLQQTVKKTPGRKRKNANQETQVVQEKSFNVSPSTSNVVTRSIQRKKIPIEPINLQDLVDKITEADNESKHENKSGSSFQDRLTTIIEEKSVSKTSRTLSVQLTRLSTTILNKHLKKENSSPNSPTINDFEISTRSDPTFTSTPLKMDVMKTLGLMPSPKNNNQVRNFVNVRRKEYGSRLSKLELLSPKKERISLISPKRDNSGSSKENFSPQSNLSDRESRKRRSLSESPKIEKKRKTKFEKTPQPSGRPSRKARPRDMKEKSMKTKMRRS